MTNMYGVTYYGKDIWENFNNKFLLPVKQEDGQFLFMDADQWVAAHPDKTFKDFNILRQEFIEKNFEIVQGTKSGGKKELQRINSVIDDALTIVESENPLSILQVQKAQAQWEKAANFLKDKKKKSTFYGFDTETIGNIFDPFRSDGYAGITEFAIGKKVVENRNFLQNTEKEIFQESYSIAFGINSTQRDNLLKLVDKYQGEGYESLTDIEKVTVSRLSMYGGDFDDIYEKTDIKFLTGKLKGKQVYTVKQLAQEDPYSINAIKKGIKNLSEVYKRQTSEEVTGLTQGEILENLVEILEDKQKGATSIVVAGNSNAFDINAIRNQAIYEGAPLNESLLKRVEDNIVDIINGDRTVASSKNVSVNTFEEWVHGRLFDASQGASIQGQMDALGYNRVETHFAADDVSNTIDLAGTKYFFKGKSKTETVLEAIQKMEEERKIQKVNYQEAQILVRNGVLDKQKMDFAVIRDGEEQFITDSFSIRSNYYTINKENTKWVTDQTGKKQLVLTMDSLDDSKLSFTKSFDSMEQMQNFLFKNTTITHDLSKEEMNNQRIISYMDFGRREFDRAFDPAEVGYSGKEDVNGFEHLKQFLQTKETLEKNGVLSKDFDITSASLEEVENKVRSVYDFSKKIDSKAIHSYYDAQAFVGTYNKLNDEEVVLKEIVKQIEPLDETNLTKTILARRAYQQIQTKFSESILGENYQRAFNYDRFKPSLEDAFSYAFEIDGEVKRVNAMTQKTAVDSFTKLLKGDQKEEAKEAILSYIKNEPFFTKGEKKKIRQSLNRMTETESNYQFIDDIAKIFREKVYSELEEDGTSPVDVLLRKLQERDFYLNEDAVNRPSNEYMNSLDFLYYKTAYNGDLNFKNDEVLKKGRTIYRDTSNNEIKTFSELIQDTIEESKIDIKAEVQQVVESHKDDPFLVQISTEEGELRHVIEELHERLGLKNTKGENMLQTSENSDLIYEMFEGHFQDPEIPTKQGEYKDYAISKYKEKGLSSFIFQQEDGKNAYVLLTTKEKTSALIEKTSEISKDISYSYKDMIDYFGDSATVLMLPAVKRTPVIPIGDFDDMGKPNGILAVIKQHALNEAKKIDDEKLRKQTIAKIDSTFNVEAVKEIMGDDFFSLNSVVQGEDSGYEKFLVPKLVTYTKKNANGKFDTKDFRAYVNHGVFEFYSGYKKVGKQVIEKTLEGDFNAASRLGKQVIDAALEPLSAPSSYRGEIITKDGKEVAKRIANYHAADYMQAFQVDFHKLKEIYRVEAKIDIPNNPLRDILQIIALDKGLIPENKSIYDPEVNKKIIDEIVDSSYFDEFFNKNLFVGIVNEDTTVTDFFERALNDRHLYFHDGINDGGAISKSNFGKDNIITLMSRLAEGEGREYLHESVVEAVNKVHRVSSFMNQILSESAMKHGLSSFVKPGEHTYLGGLFSTLRPTYSQQNRYMHFNFDDFKEYLENGFDTYTMFGTPIKSKIADTIDSAFGLNTTGTEHMLTTRFKQIGQMELTKEWERLSRNSDKIAKKNNLDPEILKKALEYYSLDAESVFEGKWYGAPSLGITNFARNLDARKVSFDTNNYNKTETRMLLEDIIQNQDGILKTGTPFMVLKNGDLKYYNGMDVKLTNGAIDELLEKGKTLLMPFGRSTDGKYQIDGAEKSTIHFLNIPEFAKYIGISEEESLKYGNTIFYEISKGASVFGNINMTKHHNDMVSFSKWTTIVKEYYEADKIPEFIRQLEAMNVSAGGIKDIDNFDDWIFEFNKDVQKYIQSNKVDKREIGLKLIQDDSRAKYLASPINTVEEMIRNGTFGNSDDKVIQRINKKIVKQLDKNKKDGLSTVTLSRNHVNETMSGRLIMDQRIEQTIRMRGNESKIWFDEDTIIPKGFENAKIANGIIDGYNGRVVEIRGTDENDVAFLGKTWDDLYLENVKKKMTEGKLGGSDFLNKRHKELGRVTNAYNQSINDVWLKEHKKIKKDEKTIKGLVNLMVYANDPQKAVEELPHKNIAVFSPKDIETGIIKVPTSGKVDAKEIEHSLFLVEGKPTEALKKIAGRDREKIVIETESHSLFFDFGGRELNVKLGKANDGKDLVRKMTGVYIPIQDLTKIQDGSVILLQHQKATTQFLNKYMNVLHNSKLDEEKNIELAELVSTYINRMSKELATMDKESTFSKTLGRTVMANSRQVLIQDITSPVLHGLSKKTDKIQNNIKKYEKAIMKGELIDGFADMDEMYKELDKHYLKLEAEAIKYARRLRKGKNIPVFDALKNTALKNQLKVKVDGKEYMHNLVGINKATLKTMGVNFGNMGMDIVESFASDNLKAIKNLNTRETLSKDWLTKDQLVSIASKLNEIKELDLGEKGIVALEKFDLDMIASQDIKTSANQILNQVNSFIENGISIEDVNKDIVKRKKLEEIYTAFEDVGVRYMKESGIYAEQLRFPLFRSQGRVRVILDETTNDEQVRYYNAIVNILSNADVDGDTSFIKLDLDGGSFVKANTEDFQILDNMYKETIERGNLILAEMLESMDYFKLDDLNDIAEAHANMLEFFEQDIYNETIAKWAKKNGYGVIKDADELAEISKGALFAARHSQELRESFRQIPLNTLTNKNLILASLPAVLRKNLIGSISTPSYILRNAIMELSNIPNSDINWNGVFYDLSNMDTVMGGFTNLAEQKSIDVKHIVDAFNLSDTPRFSSGISKLFGSFSENSSLKKNMLRKSGLEDLLYATNHITFKLNSKKEYKEKLDSILSHNLEYYDKEFEVKIGKESFYGIENIQKAIEDLLKKNNLTEKEIIKVNQLKKENNKVLFERMFRNIYESSDLQEANNIFSRQIYKMQGDLKENTLNFFNELTETLESKDLIKFYETVINLLFQSNSYNIDSESFILKENIIYTTSGKLPIINDSEFSKLEKTEKLSNMGYMYKKKNLKISKNYVTFSLDRFNINDSITEDGRLKYLKPKIFKANNITELNEKLLSFLGKDLFNVDKNKYLETPEVKSLVKNVSQLHKIVDTMTDILLDENDKLRPKLLDSYIFLVDPSVLKDTELNTIKINARNAFGKDYLKQLSDLFGLEPENKDLNNTMTDIIQTYEYIRYSPYNEFEGPQGVRALIQDINEAIVSDVSNYTHTETNEKGKVKFVFDRYEKSAEKYIEDLFKSNGLDYQEQKKIATSIGMIDYKEFADALDTLNANMYNITETMVQLDRFHKQLGMELERSLFDYPEEEVESFQDIYENFDKIKTKLRKSIKKSNEETLKEAQEKVYALFKDKEQFINTFRLQENVDSSSLVGFGKYIGIRFNSLNEENITDILKEGQKLLSDSNITGLQRDAIEMTMTSLNEYQTIFESAGTGIGANKIRMKNIDPNAIDFIRQTKSDIESYLRTKQIEELKERFGDDFFSEAEESIGKNNMKNRTLTATLLDKADEIASKLPLKTMAKVTGVMAAIGLANNLLQKGKSGSPLTPKQKEESADYENGSYVVPSSNQVIYADNNTGLQFHVAARTKNYINDIQKAKLIGMSGGGNANIYSQADTSGISDNWLANKFAELM